MNLPQSLFLRIAPIALATLLAACGQAPQAAPPAGPIQVGTYTVQAQALPLTTELPGRTNAYRIAEVRPQVSGILQQRLFEEGATVKVGQPLYQIDAATYSARLKKTEANLRAAESLAKRYQGLRASNAISQQQYDDAMAAWQQAEADVDMARIDLVYTKVLAPISGRVGRSLVTEGGLVSNGQPQALATIQQIDPIHVDLTQSSTEILRLQRAVAEGGQAMEKADATKVKLKLEDGSVYAREGTLKFSEVSVDEGTGSVVLRASFPNPDGKLLPGMFVHAQLQTGLRPDAILVPQQAVSRDPSGQAVVWVVGAEGIANPRPVQTLRTVGNTWLVGEGLQAGERVVTEGLQRLRPGMQVEALPAGNVNVVTQYGAAGGEG
ncbi:efflux RND transporter periplasmic adaptor subunit [Aromatoleum bremense]|uniref:Efflux RND transporter periplasmic adaptor subunit n=1 Tax=Aromatoleum bremense TaxID=76115 RepID=A0ABX1NYT0_9RHOO|nr:efflux RND transporter periplasmic adaptor subunit [Aromatoleum bremense]NMG17194.1 efflux RND transporter periplasmic adaptor subunit [Aromatoleum bremense]QTQ30542.1 RND efflux system, membrane fusion protein [Aromatoleum bremense]